jgi:hypothetical protein
MARCCFQRQKRASLFPEWATASIVLFQGAFFPLFLSFEIMLMLNNSHNNIRIC